MMPGIQKIREYNYYCSLILFNNCMHSLHLMIVYKTNIYKVLHVGDKSFSKRE